mmetsp:Transcript_43539/g.60443  ORF Transcript_43539/g.60443 Transcript_43539/m.60443 type:complete len:84 (+) Transcript_43539:33-284(+)
MKTIMIIALVAAMATAQFTLPDLNINTVTPDCGNYQSLQAQLVADQTRLQGIIDAVPPNLAIATDIDGIVSTVCTALTGLTVQ